MIASEKGNKQQTHDKLSDYIDRFAKIHNDEQLHQMKMERKEMEVKVIQPTENNAKRT